MANRNWANGGKVYSMHVMPVMLTCSITIGATGAVTSFKGSAIKSVTRTGTGLYKIKMQPNTNFSVLYYGAGAMQSPVSGLSGIDAVEIQNDPNTSVAIVDGGELTVKTLDPTGALANPASGSVLMVLMILSNSSVTIPGG